MGGGLPRAFWVLFGGIFVNRAGTFVVPLLAIYLTQERHLPATTAGIVVSLYGAGGMIASPLGGYLADHVGRRATMVGALLLGGAGMIALGFAQRLEFIAPGVVLVAMVGECYRPAMQAAVADLVPSGDRIRAFGLIYWVINLGFSVGVALGGLLASVSFVLLFVGDGITSILFGLLVWRLLPETLPAPDRSVNAAPKHGLVRGFLAPYRDGPFLAFIVLSVAVMLIFMQHVSTLPMDMTAHHVSRRALGLVLAVNGVLIVLVQPFLAPRLAARNRSRVLSAGATLVGLGFGLNAFAHQPWMFGACAAVWTIGEIAVLPTGNAVVADIALPELRGRYQGAYGLCFGIASFLAPLAGTAVLQHLGAHVLWIGCFVLGLLVAAGHHVLEPRLTRLRRERVSARAVAL